MSSVETNMSDEQTNILIVDDLPEKHLAYRVMLEEFDVNIVEAHSGAEALKHILKMDFAVILLDINMPGMDGLETARLIHQRKRSASTPIIFLTAFADEVRMAEGYATGAVDYLYTPIVPGVLRAKVRVFVDLFEMRRKMTQQAEAKAKQVAVEEANRRLLFLADASVSLGRSLDITATVREIVRIPVPFLADAAVIKMSVAAGGGIQFLVAHSSATRDGKVIASYYPEASFPDLKEALERVTTNSERVELTTRPGIILPLQARGRTVAALALFSESNSRFFGANDISLAEAFAYRAAMALDNALLHEDLRSADRQKTDFLSMLAHELRNPLAPIRNAVQFLGHDRPDTAETKWACEVIDRQTNQLVRLVDDLLDVARITHDKISLRRDKVELQSVVNCAVEATQSFIDSKNHRLYVATSASPVYVIGDLARLTQVVTNLLNNAAKFTEEGGQIWLTTGLEDTRAVIRVRDNGIGIPPEMLECIFDLFTQVDRTLDRVHQGLGVGLTLVKRLIEKHEGVVEARSDGIGHGSEFIVRLPSVPAPVTGKSRSPTSNGGIGVMQTHRVLVVDDNRDSAESLAMILRIMGQHTETAFDGLSAIRTATDFKPELILLDIGLPQMNGYQVCQRIRQLFDGAQMTIVALTGWGQEEDQRQSAAAGFDRHIVKPVDITVLKELIAQLKSPVVQLASNALAAD